MNVWIMFAAMAALTALVLLRPVLRDGKTDGKRIDYDINVYRDQLAEIDRDSVEGLLNKEQANAARIEIQRRMLAAADAEALAISTRITNPAVARIVGIVIIGIFMPACALLLYGFLGSPDLRDQPYMARNVDFKARMGIDRDGDIAP